ncbi:MAG: ABC transporter permease [bacterium]
MKSRIISVSKKEFIEIRRDLRTLFMVLALPTVMLILYSYAISFDLKSINIIVCDLDKSSDSRKLIDEFRNSGYFSIKYIERYADIDKEIDNGNAMVALCIPKGFSKSLGRREISELQAIVDSSDANTATIAISYIDQIIQLYSMNIYVSIIRKYIGYEAGNLPPIKMQTRVWYNPELKSTNFIVPGLIANIIMMLGSIMTSLSIVSEKENGTFEKLIVTPIRSYELIIGKILPYSILAFIDVIFCLLVGKFWFKVPIRGSVPILLFLSILFLFSILGIGLLISSIAKTQRVAMVMSMLSSLLPTFLLSGFVFPIESMPKPLQLVTYIVPARYFLEILRGILLKGNGMKMLWSNTLCLVIYGFIMITFSTLRFKKHL